MIILQQANADAQPQQLDYSNGEQNKQFGHGKSYLPHTGIGSGGDNCKKFNPNSFSINSESNLYSLIHNKTQGAVDDQEYCPNIGNNSPEANNFIKLKAAQQEFSKLQH